jgi:hypothetical protein
MKYMEIINKYLSNNKFKNQPNSWKNIVHINPTTNLQNPGGIIYKIYGFWWSLHDKHVCSFSTS